MNCIHYMEFEIAFTYFANYGAVRAHHACRARTARSPRFIDDEPPAQPVRARKILPRAQRIDCMNNPAGPPATL